MLPLRARSQPEILLFPWTTILQYSPRRGFATLLVFALLASGRPSSASVLEEEDDYYDSYEADDDDEEEEASRAVAVHEIHREARQSSNAYYDFIVTEYSYKIWVVFMIYTMVSVFYACLVAAYFAETNTLAPTQAFDYDYVIKRSVYGQEAANVLDTPPRLSQQAVDRVLRAISSTPPPLHYPGQPEWTKGGVGRKRRRGAQDNSGSYSLGPADPT